MASKNEILIAAVKAINSISFPDHTSIVHNMWRQRDQSDGEGERLLESDNVYEDEDGVVVVIDNVANHINPDFLKMLR